MQTLKNLRKAPEYGILAEKIKSLLKEGEKVVFSPGSGNWGDGLINYGSRQFFSAHGIQSEEIAKSKHLASIRSQDYAEKVVLVGGGGAWGRNWNRNRGIVQEISKQARHVIVLPTTYDLPPVESSNISYFSRDKYSSLSNVENAIFCPDMAFFTSLNVPEPEQTLFRVFAMREDREGLGYGKYFPGNLDISLFGNGESTKMQPFFKVLNQYEIIVTDRLHVAIAGAMLGRTVKLVPGNYPKNLDLFQSSLKSNYDNVSLCSIEDVLEWYKFSHL